MGAAPEHLSTAELRRAIGPPTTFFHPRLLCPKGPCWGGSPPSSRSPLWQGFTSRAVTRKPLLRVRGTLRTGLLRVWSKPKQFPSSAARRRRAGPPAGVSACACVRGSVRGRGASVSSLTAPGSPSPRHRVRPGWQRRRRCQCSVTALALGGGPARTQLTVMERCVSESPGETCLFSKSDL